MRPLYRFDGKAFPSDAASASAHPGLLFDKFVDGWDSNWFIPNDAKKDLYLKAAKPPASDELQNGLDAALRRQRQLAAALGEVEPLQVATDWRFVSGLGTGHPFEAGFIWHRTLGVPYLPGSSVKGMVRAWAEQWCGSEEHRQAATRLFGPRGESTGDQADTGTLIVFDALPLTVPKLEIDIMNPHYGPYYDDRTKPPADYYSPIPVFFLTVAPGQWFRFSLAPRPGAYVGDDAESREKEDLARGRMLLETALDALGAGGKTAVVYGRFTTPSSKSGSLTQGTASETKGDNTTGTSIRAPAAAPAKDEFTRFCEWFDGEGFVQGKKRGSQDHIEQRIARLPDPSMGRAYVRVRMRRGAATESLWAFLTKEK